MYICKWDTYLYELNPLQSMSHRGFTAIETKSAEVIRSILSARGWLVMRAYECQIPLWHSKRAFSCCRSFSRSVHFLLNPKTYSCWIRTPGVKTRNRMQTLHGRDTFHRMSILVYFFHPRLIVRLFCWARRRLSWPKIVLWTQPTVVESGEEISTRTRNSLA